MKLVIGDVLAGKWLYLLVAKTTLSQKKLTGMYWISPKYKALGCTLEEVVDKVSVLKEES